MNRYILIFFGLATALNGMQDGANNTLDLRQIIGQNPAGVLYLDQESADRAARAIAGIPAYDQRIQQLETIVAQQHRTMRYMGIVFIVAGAGFCCGIAKTVYESYRDKKHVSSKDHGLLQQYIKSQSGAKS